MVPQPNGTPTTHHTHLAQKITTWSMFLIKCAKMRDRERQSDWMNFETDEWTEEKKREGDKKRVNIKRGPQIDGWLRGPCLSLLSRQKNYNGAGRKGRERGVSLKIRKRERYFDILDRAKTFEGKPITLRLKIIH
jgi:hypothetical protein